MTEFRLNGSGKVLRFARDQAGLSVRDLAKRLGWNPGTLSKYENNQLGVSLEVVEEIADALGCPREELAFRCLQERYGTLAKPNTKVGKLATTLVEALAKQVGKKPH